MNRDRLNALNLGILILVGIAGAMSHYHLILLSGSVIIALILLVKNWRWRAILALVGIVILLPILVFVMWHNNQIVIEGDNIWFSTEPQFILHQSLRGLSDIVKPLSRAIILGTLIVVFVYYVRQGSAVKVNVETVSFYKFLVICCLMTPILGIIVSVVYKPIYSFRTFVIITPFIWGLSGLLVNYILHRIPTIVASLAIGLIVPILFFTSLQNLPDRDMDMEQGWRESATFVQGLSNCKDDQLIVSGLALKYISGNESVRLYGYYMANADQIHWYEIPETDFVDECPKIDFHGVIEARLSSDKACPLLLWSVNHLSFQKVKRYARYLVDNVGIPEGKSVIIKRFGTSGYVVILE